MKNKIFAAFAGIMLLVDLAGVSLAANTGPRKAETPQVNDLVALLPSSDAIVTLDAKRFFRDALPQLLSANQPMLAAITGKIDELQQTTGIDLRQFEQVAGGFALKPGKGKDVSFDPVLIARGTIKAGGLVSLVKIASNGKYTEQKVGERTIYIFSTNDITLKNAPAAANSKVGAAVNRSVNSLTSEIAVSAYDENTLVFGSVGRVRQTLAGMTRVEGTLTNLLSRDPDALASFAGKTPFGMTRYLPLENDELGKTLDSIRFLSGSMSVANGTAAVKMAAQTTTPERAQSLLETLEGLQSIGKAFLGGAKGQDKEVYSRMIDNARFARTANEVRFDLSVQQSDIDILVGSLKPPAASER